MRYRASEKLEIIRTVDASHLPARPTSSRARSAWPPGMAVFDV